MRGFWPTLIVGIGTYLSRASFILLLANRMVSPRFQRAMRNVGPSVLAALVATLLVGESGLGGLGPSPEMFALASAGVVAWKTHNMAWSLVAGMVSMWLLGAIW